MILRIKPENRIGKCGFCEWVKIPAKKCGANVNYKRKDICVITGEKFVGCHRTDNGKITFLYAVVFFVDYNAAGAFEAVVKLNLRMSVLLKSAAGMTQADKIRTLANKQFLVKHNFHL